jgi:ubiquitin-activating enzyme E1 C
MIDRYKFPAIAAVLDSVGPFADPDYEPGDQVCYFDKLILMQSHKTLEDCKILVIGAGGLGCEILKNLALSGFTKVTVIDMDTIDISNLNRQFLFRREDIGKSKAITAANFIMTRVQGITVTPYHAAIQDMGDDFYASFDIVICGLDSVEARRWINATLVNLVDPSNPKSLVPLIDGGTEGFKGQARVILPTLSSCYECSLDMLTKKTTYPICTIQNTPRLPEHCIEWASVLEWPRLSQTKLDPDDPGHIDWLLEQALARAAKFGIGGITRQLVQGVVKNIIPAIASTNAIIAAACTNEALKIATGCNPYLDNYMMYTGDEGVYTYTFQHEKKENCPVCGSLAQEYAIDNKCTLEDLVQQLQQSSQIQLKQPSLRTSRTSLYMQAPPSLEATTRPNLKRRIGELVDEGEEVVVTDSRLPLSLRLKLAYHDN